MDDQSETLPASLRERKRATDAALRSLAPAYPRVHELGDLANGNLLAFPLPADVYQERAQAWADWRAPLGEEQINDVLSDYMDEKEADAALLSLQERQATQATLQSLFEFFLLAGQTVTMGTPAAVATVVEPEPEGNDTRRRARGGKKPDATYGAHYTSRFAIGSEADVARSDRLDADAFSTGWVAPIPDDRMEVESPRSPDPYADMAPDVDYARSAYARHGPTSAPVNTDRSRLRRELQQPNPPKLTSVFVRLPHVSDKGDPDGPGGGILLLVRVNDPAWDPVQFYRKLKDRAGQLQAARMQPRGRKPNFGPDERAFLTGYGRASLGTSERGFESFLQYACVYRELTGSAEMEAGEHDRCVQQAAAPGTSPYLCAGDPFNPWDLFSLRRALLFLTSRGADVGLVHTEPDLASENGECARLCFDEPALAYALPAGGLGWNRTPGATLSSAGLGYELFPWHRRCTEASAARSGAKFSAAARLAVTRSDLGQQREGAESSPVYASLLKGNRMPTCNNAVLALGGKYIRPWGELARWEPGAPTEDCDWLIRSDAYARKRDELCKRIVGDFDTNIWSADPQAKPVTLNRGHAAVRKWHRQNWSTRALIPAEYGALPQLRRDLDGFGTYLERFAAQSRYVLLIGTHQRQWLAIHFGPGRDVMRMDFDLHAHWIGSGEAAAGKSFLLDTERRTAIPGTVIVMDNQSAKAMFVDEDLSGVVIVSHEGGGDLLAPPDRRGQESPASSLVKRVLDGCQLSYQLLDLQEQTVDGLKTNVRVLRNIHTNAILTLVVVTNMGVDKFPPAVLSRALVAQIQGSVRSPLLSDADRYAAFPASEAVFGSADDLTPMQLATRLEGRLTAAECDAERSRKAKLAKKALDIVALQSAEVTSRQRTLNDAFETSVRVEQLVVTLAYTFVHLRVLPQINVRLCGLLLPLFFAELRARNAMGSITGRTVERATIYARNFCLVDAYVRVFLRPTGKRWLQPFRIDHVVDLAPYLFVQVAHVVAAASLIADEFVDPLPGQVLRGVYAHAGLSGWTQRMVDGATETSALADALAGLEDRWSDPSGFDVRPTGDDGLDAFEDVRWLEITKTDAGLTTTYYDCNYVVVSLTSTDRREVGTVVAGELNKHTPTSADNVWACFQEMAKQRVELSRWFEPVSRDAFSAAAAAGGSRLRVARGKRNFPLAEFETTGNGVSRWRVLVHGYRITRDASVVKEAWRRVLSSHRGCVPRTVKLCSYADLGTGRLDELRVVQADVAAAPHERFEQDTANYVDDDTAQHLYGGHHLFEEEMVLRSHTASVTYENGGVMLESSETPDPITPDAYFAELRAGLPQARIVIAQDFDDWAAEQHLLTCGAVLLRTIPTLQWQHLDEPNTAWHDPPTHANLLQLDLADKDAREDARRSRSGHARVEPDRGLKRGRSLSLNDSSQ